MLDNLKLDSKGLVVTVGGIEQTINAVLTTFSADDLSAHTVC